LHDAISGTSTSCRFPKDNHSIEYNIPKHEHYELDGDSIAKDLTPKSTGKGKQWLKIPAAIVVGTLEQAPLELAIGLFALPFLALYYLLKGSDQKSTQ